MTNTHRTTLFPAAGLLCLLLSIFGTVPAALADWQLEIIPLKHRTLDEVLPVVQPFAGPDGTVTGMNNQLILRVSPERLRDIREILQSIDHPPARLMISVRQGDSSERTRQSAGAQANVEIGDDGRIVIGPDGRRLPSNSVVVQLDEKESRRESDMVHRVQATEGRPALIESGRLVPLPQTQTGWSGGRPYRAETLSYYPATSGFYVVPRLSGDRVTLEINPHQRRTGKRRGTIQFQGASSTVSGKLGEWIPLGGVDSSANRKDSGILRRGEASDSRTSGIWVMVERLD
jgi:hypothetical protein